MKGVIFSPESVKAILDGRKTMTRRLVKPQPAQVEDIVTLKPRYKRGETVYVKETFKENDEHDGGWEPEYNRSTVPYFYAADYRNPSDMAPWQSPLFMPKKLARLFVKIEDVRVERLNQITYDDAIAEGIPATFDAVAAAREWKRLWDSLNPKHPWESNPFVWVYTFSPVEAKE